MPVGTQATVKGLTPDQVRATGSRMVLANTYHLALRPGEDVVAALGGLHAFMGWDGPILTDSGGFQAFSLAARSKLTEAGRRLPVAPRRPAARSDARAGRGDPGRTSGPTSRCASTSAPPCPPSKEAIAAAVGRTVRWAGRCKEAHTPGRSGPLRDRPGGSHADLRAECAEALIALDFDGYAVGGVSVGEGREEVRQGPGGHDAPAARRTGPRYLMGVGRPQDILDAVATGIDLFDCVLPTRNGRNATCLTGHGPVKLRNAAHRLDPRPIEEGCDCLACRRFSRAYLRHLFMANEMLGPILASIHNLAYLQRLTRQVREAIREGRFVQFRAEVLEALGP